MICPLGRSVPAIGALLGLAWGMSGCRPKSASDAPRSRWSLLVASPDTVLIDTAGVEWVPPDARVWLRMPRQDGDSTTRPVAAVETHHDISCERREIRDREIRAVGVTGEVVGDRAVRDPSWIPASAHPTLRNLLAALCARLSELDPRGLHSLLGSDRP